MIIIKTPPTWKCFLWSLNHHSKATIRQKVRSAKKKKKRTQKVHNIKPFILGELKAHCSTVQVLVLVLCMRGYTLVLNFIARAADAYSLSVALDLTITSFSFTTIEEAWWLLGSMPNLFSWLKLQDNDINSSISCNINYYIFILWQVKNGKTSVELLKCCTLCFPINSTMWLHLLMHHERCVIIP